MTADPSMPAQAGSPSSWNLFAYTGGDPINYLDPSGLEALGMIEYGANRNCWNVYIEPIVATQGLSGADRASAFFTNSNLGVLATTMFFEAQVSGQPSTEQSRIWIEIGWVFVNRYRLSSSDKDRLYGASATKPTSFVNTIKDGTRGSQVWASDGTLKSGFVTSSRYHNGLRDILNGSAEGGLCAGLVASIRTAGGVLNGDGYQSLTSGRGGSLGNYSGYGALFSRFLSPAVSFGSGGVTPSGVLSAVGSVGAFRFFGLGPIRADSGGGSPQAPDPVQPRSSDNDALMPTHAE